MKSKQQDVCDTFFSENYRVIDQIGEGGYGSVYLAEQISTGQKVAIKTLKKQQGLTEQKVKQLRARFERETRICAEINHPNIVKLLDKGYSKDSGSYAVFEFIDGETLKEHIKRNTCLSAADMGKIMGQVLEALVYAHKKGIVHRDLKPQNIMVTLNQTKKHAKILDFGIGAFTQEVREAEYEHLTVTSDLLGTPAYISPEQLRGQPPTIKSDIYAWGLMVVECLTGNPVMDGMTAAEIFQKQLMPGNVPIPASLIDHALGNLLRRVLEKDPTNRPGDTQLLYEEFEQINFETLTGNLYEPSSIPENISDKTEINESFYSYMAGSQKQLTLLCLRLNLSIADNSRTDLKMLDTIQKDQLNQCRDTAVKYGGWVSDPFMNHMAIYFGYPESSDTDSRRAARTALELVTTVQKRGALLHKHGVGISIQVALHTGTVLIQHNQVPQGIVPNAAFDLANLAPPGNVLVSASSKKLLDAYLEFEKSGQYENRFHETVFKLVGERRTEAISSLGGRRYRNRMIGREKEKHLILDTWQQTAQKGSAILIKGQAGIGKSILCNEIKKQIQKTTHKVNECRCFPENKNNALFPFLTMFKEQWGISQTEDDNLTIETLKNILAGCGCTVEDSLPLLCSWMSLSLTGNYSIKHITPEAQKRILFDTLKKCIFHIDKDKPFLLVVEDLHWIDQTSTEFIAHLLSDIGQQHYMLLMTTRPEFSLDTHTGDFTELPLNVLEEYSIKELIQFHLGGKAFGQSVFNYILERSDGIPFFVEELTRMMLDRNVITLKSNGYVFEEDSNMQAIPMSLQDLLNAKIDKLNFAKETAQLAASLGREFNYALLVKASLKDEASVQADLNLLMQNNIVYQQRRVQDSIYIFNHALIRDAAYDTMTRGFRKEIHAHIAEAIQEHFPKRAKENLFELAGHMAGAENFNNAVQYGHLQVKKLVSKAQYQEALSILNEVKQWIAQIDDEAEEKGFRLKTNDLLLPVYQNTDGYGTSKSVDIFKENTGILEFFRQNPTESDGTDYEDIALKSECMYLLQLHISNQREKALKTAQPVLNKLKNKNFPELDIMVQALIGQMLLFDGSYEEAQNFLEHVVNKEDELANVPLHNSFGYNPIAMSHCNLACMYTILGNFQKTQTHLDKGLACSVRTHDPSDIILSYVYKSLLMGLFNEREAVKQTLQEFQAKYSDIKDSYWSAVLLVFMEDWAIEETENSLKTRQALIDAQQDAYLTWYELLLLDTLLKNKKFDDAYQIALQAKKRNVKSHEKCLLAKVYNFLGCSLYQKSRTCTDLVHRYFREGISLARAQKSLWFELEIQYNYATVLKECGHKAEAARIRESMKQIAVHFDNNTLINTIKSFVNLNL